MPSARPWLAGPKRLFWSFILVLLLPAAAVVWMGFRLVAQDRELEVQQQRERRGVVADRLVADVEKALASAERQLATATPDLKIRPDDDAVVIVIRATGIDVSPAARLLYVPGVRPLLVESSAEFTEGERAEVWGDDVRAAGIYQALGTSRVEAVRAGALVRLARTWRRMDRHSEVLAVYDELARLPRVSVAGLPADLVARRARIALLASLNRREEMQLNAAALQVDLFSGRWTLDRGTFEDYSAQLRQWVGTEPADVTDWAALSDAVDWLWQQRQLGTLTRTGRTARKADEGEATILWTTKPGPVDATPASTDPVTALVAGRRYRDREWLEPALARGDARSFGVTFLPSAPSARQDTMAAVPVVRRSSVDTLLPWTLLVGDRVGAPAPAAAGSRRNLILVGLSLLFLTVTAGGYVVARGVTHELAVARRQSDFVAAVSHEFRTPLTSLQQFTSLLNEAPEPSPDKRRAFYQAQGRAVDGLNRLVEGLLDFGRMEAGAHEYRMERIPVAPFVAAVVDEFRSAGTADGFTVTCSVDASGAEVRGDREALARALHNLLENAVKYRGRDVGWA